MEESLSAMAVEIQSAAFRETEAMLYAWGDESRERAGELGLPVMSGIARMIEQQRVFEQRARARRSRSRKAVPHRLTDGTRASLCVCGCIFVEAQCPRCKHDPRPPDAQVHGTETRSFRPVTMKSLSSNTAVVEEIVRTAPNETQKLLKRKYLFRQRDSKAAEQLRVTKARYREYVESAVEYVVDRLADRACAPQP